MQMNFLLLLTIVIFAVFDCHGQYENYNNGLYALTDDVEILTGNDFHNHFYWKKHGWLVKFYMNWCGHCQNFATYWKSFATDVRDWSPLVKVAAMDCAQAENSQLCTQLGVFGVPVVRYYHEWYNPAPENIGVEVTTADDITTIRHNLLHTLQMEQVEGRFQHAPHLLPYHGTDLSGLWSPENVQPHIFVIVEDGWDKLGSEVIMDLHYAKNVVIKRAVPSELFNMPDLPALIVVHKNKNVETITPQQKTKESFKNAIKTYAKSKGLEVFDPEPPVFNEHLKGSQNQQKPKDLIEFEQLKNTLDKMGDVVFQADFESTIQYSLKQEIVGQPTIDGMKKSSLSNFLNLLIKYIPLSENGLNFIKELKTNIDKQMSITTEALRQLIQELEQKYDPVYTQPLQWIACRGSTSAKRGYPCGLWKLFHYATVQASQVNKYPNYEVLPVMHDYIKYFFACSYCSQHFQEMSLRRKLKDVIDGNQAILWLWTAHNEVNKRLAGDQSEDPAFPKVEFPTWEHCPQCRTRDGTWNNGEILKYLKQVYNSQTVQKSLPPLAIQILANTVTFAFKSASVYIESNTVDNGTQIILKPDIQENIKQQASKRTFITKDDISSSATS